MVNSLSWRYHEPAGNLSQRLGISPAHAFYGPVGGESPIRYLHEAAQRIARGECGVAAVCGAEAQSTATKAERAGVTLPWTPFAHDAEEPKRGAALPEAAGGTSWASSGRSRSIRSTRRPRRRIGARRRTQALAESGELWSTYSEVAAHNPNAWLKRRFTPAEITTPSADNRLIAWPYTKLMVANPDGQPGRGDPADQPRKGACRRYRGRSHGPHWGGAAAEDRATIWSATSFSRATPRTRCCRR